MQQAQLLRRRVAVMTAPLPSGVGGIPSLPGQSPGASLSPASAAVSQPSQQPLQHQAPSIGMKPGTQTPPANVLQVVKQVSFPSVSCLV